MDNPIILTIRNEHIEECGSPPKLDIKPKDYVAYFHNQYGEQTILQYNPTNNTCQMWMGDVGWEEPLKVISFRGKILVLFARSQKERQEDRRMNKQFDHGIKSDLSDLEIKETVKQEVYRAYRKMFGKPTLTDEECEMVSNGPILNSKELETIAALWKMWTV